MGKRDEEVVVMGMATCVEVVVVGVVVAADGSV